MLFDLQRIAGEEPVAPPEAPPVDFVSGPALLEQHTEELLGTVPPGRVVRIMVTMPVEAGREYKLVYDLLVAGMDIMRVNCAHDERKDWLGMVENLRRARSESQRDCRILVDLGGPKLRTGELEAGPQVVRWRPQRDACGIAKSPARIWLTPANAPQPAPVTPHAVLYVADNFLKHCRQGDMVITWDCEHIKRCLPVVAMVDGSCWADSSKTVYLPAGAPLALRRGKRNIARGHLGTLPPVIKPLTLQVGDGLLLTTEALPGRGPIYSPHGELLEPARIPCTLPEVFADVHPGERIFFDDGKIGGVIRTVGAEWLEICITQARPGGAKLRPDKGINLPDSTVRLPALTAKDLYDLDFAITAADFIGLSFVHTPDDVLHLHEEMQARGSGELGIMLKIENRIAFSNLPRLLLMGMRFPPFGIMVARGDLAVEVGYERLAEVQEEILWLCEAAHVPVIWATQVLESLAQQGTPSRSEVTDAAMSERADCVMLNKGPHVVAAVRFLANVLQRMQLHQEKKRAMLRRLSISEIS